MLLASPFELGRQPLNGSARSCPSEQLAAKILGEVLRFRRGSAASVCSASPCPSCLAPHLPAAVAAIKQAQPITFVLPAFPGKSPNLDKVLGPLPDMAERRSLLFLDWLCKLVQRHHAPGARIILCSDGRVFSDIVGMQEGNVSAYQRQLARMIDELSLAFLSTFTLEDVFASADFVQMRDALMENFGADPAAAAADQEATRMYRGITRFLFEDSLYAGQLKSRTALQKEARSKAYEVIRRSNAWSRLIAAQYPDAIRLSIHPQVCGSRKLGMRLIADESWMTPWHGVALATPTGWVLVKRAEAVALGAQLVLAPDGQPSHFTLAADSGLPQEQAKPWII